MEISLKEYERIDDLEFKGLKIIQNVNNFCFGIDAVLLSDFAKNIKKGSKVVDLGTGTGIIPILLCGKTNLSKIYGLEIQSDMCDMARRSISLNDLNDRFEIINDDIKNADKIFEKNSIDVVVTNPPYKKLNSGIINDSDLKTIARHEVLCNIEDIIKQSFNILKNNGELYMIHRPERLVDIIYNLRKYKLEPKVIRFVQPYVDKEPTMVLIKAVKNGNPFLRLEKPLIVYNDDRNYTDEIFEIYNK